MSLTSALSRAFKDTGKNNVLHFACMRNDLNFIQETQQEDLNFYKKCLQEKNPQGRTAIWLAVASDFVEIVKYFLTDPISKNNIDFLAVDIKSHCLVMAAVRHNSYRSLEILLDLGKLDPNGNENAVLVPLSIAAREGYVECLSLLLRYNAVVDGREDMYKFGLLERPIYPMHPFFNAYPRGMSTPPNLEAAGTTAPMPMPTIRRVSQSMDGNNNQDRQVRLLSVPPPPGGPPPIPVRPELNFEHDSPAVFAAEVYGATNGRIEFDPDPVSERNIPSPIELPDSQENQQLPPPPRIPPPPILPANFHPPIPPPMPYLSHNTNLSHSSMTTTNSSLTTNSDSLSNEDINRPGTNSYDRNIKLSNPGAQSPLHTAIIYNNEICARLLIAFGASLNLDYSENSIIWLCMRYKISPSLFAHICSLGAKFWNARYNTSIPIPEYDETDQDFIQDTTVERLLADSGFDSSISTHRDENSFSNDASNYNYDTHSFTAHDDVYDEDDLIYLQNLEEEQRLIDISRRIILRSYSNESGCIKRIQEIRSLNTTDISPGHSEAANILQFKKASTKISSNLVAKIRAVNNTYIYEQHLKILDQYYQNPRSLKEIARLKIREVAVKRQNELYFGAKVGHKKGGEMPRIKNLCEIIIDEYKDLPDNQLLYLLAL